MATQRQIEANRRNAQKSTGPRTLEGKQKSRWNALRHGLASVHNVLPHEDPAEYHRIRAELIQTWQPANAQELMLIDQVAGGYWRMQRSLRFETALFDQHVQCLKTKHGLDTAPSGNDDEAIVVSMCDDENETGYRLWFRYDARAQSTYYRALAHLRQLHNDRLRRERLPQPRSVSAATGRNTLSAAALAPFGAEASCTPAATSGETTHSDPAPPASAVEPGNSPRPDALASIRTDSTAVTPDRPAARPPAPISEGSLSIPTASTTWGSIGAAPSDRAAPPRSAIPPRRELPRDPTAQTR